MTFFKKKPIDKARESTTESGLNKHFGAFDLIMLALGGIVGSGVFVLIGLVAANYSGPAVTISYAIAGGTCIFVALVYTELATMIPTSGSVYTYSYVALGEVFAWLVASALILELVVASGVIAAGWSGYVQGILSAAGFPLHESLSKIPSEGGIINLPAVLIVIFVGVILYLGNTGSKKLNIALVFIKMAAIVAFIIFALPHFDITNWSNFMPFGVDNVIFGASMLFFAFTGFSILAASAEECKNPSRDLTIGIIGSLVLATIIYVIVGGLATGIVPFDKLNNAQPLSFALSINNSHVGSIIVATGAVCGMTTVIMANLYGVSRIYYVIARDGLLPKSLAKVHKKYDTPHMALVIFVVCTAILGAFCPLQTLAKLSNMGALIDYIFVTVIVVLLRFTSPKVARPFKCPALFMIAPIAFLASGYLLMTFIVDKNWKLLNTGKIMIYWFTVAFMLYVIQVLIKKRSKKKHA